MILDKSDIILKGWVIEYAHNTTWQQHLNRKVYSSESIANNALEEIRKNGFYGDRIRGYLLKFRIVPLYTLSLKLERWISINNIIDSV